MKRYWHLKMDKKEPIDDYISKHDDAADGIIMYNDDIHRWFIYKSYEFKELPISFYPTASWRELTHKEAIHLLFLDYL